MSYISIAKEFSRTPGGRKRAYGRHSAEEFLETILMPAYAESFKKGEPLQINLDGTYGYAASFLDEAFAGLARTYDPKDVLSRLEFISNEEPQLIGDIKGYIKETLNG